MVWQVLTTGSWPTQTAPKCTLPREVDEACTRFKDFYLSTHSGRKLSWQTNMGNAGQPTGSHSASISWSAQKAQSHTVSQTVPCQMCIRTVAQLDLNNSVPVLQLQAAAAELWCAGSMCLLGICLLCSSCGCFIMLYSAAQQKHTPAKLAGPAYARMVVKLRLRSFL